MNPTAYVVTEADRRRAAESLARQAARDAGLPLPARPPAYATAPYPVWLVKTIAAAKRRARDARYQASDKGKARSARYDATWRGRARCERYNGGGKGREREEAREQKRREARVAMYELMGGAR